MTTKGRAILFIMSALLCGLIGSSMLRAQAVGEITGTITDSTGGVIPGAKVTATRVETGVSQSTVTTGAGIYTIPRLIVGTYTVTANARGFKTGTVSGITLDVSQQREVNFRLVLAGVTSKVEVSAAPPLLNTTNATMAGVVTTAQVQDLPLNGRDITQLVFLEPGMAQDSGSMGWMGSTPDVMSQWISNGNRGETETGTLDGADISDAEMGTLQFTNFNLDAIAQFKVMQNDYSAQYGSGGGTITEIVSKSGTNRFHGSLFEYVRNSALFDARNFFGTTVSPLKRNEFGGTFGGPIKKNKTFFFWQYAGLRQREGEPDIVAVPTAAERNGAVTITGSNGQPDDLQVPLNPLAASLLSRYPMPNQPSGEFGPETYNFIYPRPLNDDQFSARLDQHFSAKDSLFVRASYVNNIVKDTDALAAAEDGSNFSQTAIGEARNYALGETHIFTPTLVNVFNFTLNRGIEGEPEVPAEATTTDTSFLDGSLANYGPDSFLTKYVTTLFDPSDNISWVHGRHSFNIGGSFIREWDNGTGVTSEGPSGAMNFDSGTPLTEAIPSTNGGLSLPAGTASPLGLISMMEGDVDYYDRSLSVPPYGTPTGGGATWWGVRRSMMAAYIQDDFKATRRLTLNLGLRYEYDSVPWEVDDRMSEPDETSGALYGDFLVNPEPYWQSDPVAGDFGPRFGLALDLGHNTVLRGGFAIFTNQIPTVYADQDLVDFPIASFSSLPNARYSLSPLPVSLPVLTSVSGVPVAVNGNTKSIPRNTPISYEPYVSSIGPLIGDFASGNLRNGYTESSNFTLEHQFGGGVAVQASYVANDGVSLYTQDYPNAMAGAEPQYTPFSNKTPGLSELQAFNNEGFSYYNGLQLQVQKISPAHGITFQANYTWAKDMTDADDVWAAGTPNGTDYNGGAIMENNPECRMCEYAPASYQVAQRFSANFMYNLPFGQWPALSRLPRRLTQGWSLLGIISAQTGFPFTVGTSYPSLQYGFDSYDGLGDRPFLEKKATRSPVLEAGCGPQYFSNAVTGLDTSTCQSALEGVGTGFFGVPLVASPITGSAALTSPGNLGRNTFTGPGWSNFDFSVIKDTRITESKTLQFRAEFFNIFNQATFGDPDNLLGSTGFGEITSTASAEREIQFALRFIF